MKRVSGTKESCQALWKESAGPASVVAALDGDWKVRRLSGPVPMPGVYKDVRDGRGRTWARWSPFPALPFHLEQREDSVMLVYDVPFSTLQDELRREPDGSWLGRARVAGRQYAWFRMVPLGNES